MAKKNLLTIEDAEIRWPNFSGKEGKYNPAGRRNFCLLLDPDVADQLQKDGWNVRYLEPLEPDDAPQAYIQVNVRFDSKNPSRNPKIILVSSSGKSQLDEESVGLLDWADIEYVDLSVRPYEWDVSGRSGVKGYLQTMYATIHEDAFEKKYRNAPDSAKSAIGGCGHCETCDGHCHDGGI